MNLVECGLRKDNLELSSYKVAECGSDVPLENCSYYEYKIKQLPNEKKWKELFENSNCKKILSDSLDKNISNAYNIYTDIDKKRIDAEYKYNRNKKILIGGMALLIVLGIIIIKNKKI